MCGCPAVNPDMLHPFVAAAELVADCGLILFVAWRIASGDTTVASHETIFLHRRKHPETKCGLSTFLNENRDGKHAVVVRPDLGTIVQ
jgi:hypothetical protein